MLRIRLRRVGKKGHPSYRIVVADSRAPRDGAYVEWIGNYDPMAEPPAVTIKADRAQAWLSQGAQPSDAVARILDWNGILTRTPTQRNAGSKTAEEAPAEAAPAPAPAAAAPAAEPEAEETPAAAEDTSEETVAEVVAEEAVEEAAEAPTSEEESGDSAGDDAEETSEEESSE
ncbi:MAG: 30S ribosomal protein S16 [Dehalococcoidia bacterium]|nr:30S ribosomal protein S16 [Dehalococcoidia bacterium]